MSEPGRRSWVLPLILVGLAYVVIGIGFAAPANTSDPARVRLWRLAAWVASGFVGAGHIAYEHFANLRFSEER